MKKIGKVLSLVMALTLVVCSLSSTAFAAATTEPALIPSDGIYKIDSINAVDVSVAQNYADGIKSTVPNARIYYTTFFGSSPQFISIINGTVNTDFNIETAVGVMQNCLLNQKAYVYGKYSKVESKGICHYEFIDDADDVEVRIVPGFDFMADQSYLVDAYPIVNGAPETNNYLLGRVDNQGTPKYQVMTVSADGIVYNNYTLIDDVKALAEDGGLYIYTNYVEPETTTEAPTEETTVATTAATTSATTSTAPKTGDSAMTATFIALGVVALAGIAVVTFASKKEN